MPEQHHICILIASLKGGGAERVAVTLANGFAARGVCVDLVVGHAVGPYLKLVSEQVNLINLGRARISHCLLPFVRYLRRNRPSAVLSFIRYTNLMAIVAHSISGSKARLVVSERVSIRHEVQTRGDRLAKWLMGRLYVRADMATVVARDMVEELTNYTGLPADRVIAIYNPVIDAGLKRRLAMPAPVEPPWPVGRSGPVVLAAGRLTAQKDFPTLLHAFRRILPTYQEAQLVILGEGALMDALVQLAKDLGIGDRVHFTGFVDDPFVAMKAADLFVLSSRSEGLPGVLIQAMACGTPVVSTDCPTGPREILENGRWGRLVPVGDPGAMADAILATLAERSHPAVTTRAQDFSEDRAIEQYLDVLLPNSADKKWISQTL
jgi:glycosyltransferase involved in cell wall biosynthesis